jgi:hypothetical protein
MYPQLEEEKRFNEWMKYTNQVHLFIAIQVLNSFIFKKLH